jgi:hypothetical protein
VGIAALMNLPFIAAQGLSEFPPKTAYLGSTSKGQSEIRKVHLDDSAPPGLETADTEPSMDRTVILSSKFHDTLKSDISIDLVSAHATFTTMPSPSSMDSFSILDKQDIIINAENMQANSFFID